jgi:hypothetical protein
MIVGMETGIIVVLTWTAGVERTDDRTMQLRVADPSFPALSHAVTRIMKVPETSDGTVRGRVPDPLRFRAAVIQVIPASVEYETSTPAMALSSDELHSTSTISPVFIWQYEWGEEIETTGCLAG